MKFKHSLYNVPEEFMDLIANFNKNFVICGLYQSKKV